MKLILKNFIIAAVAAAAFSTVSYAANYNNGQVTVTPADVSSVKDVSDTDMLTVLVVNSEIDLSSINSDNILYIDQGTGLSTFLNAGTTSFGVAGGTLSDGTYAMYIGASSKDSPVVQYFTVYTADPQQESISAGVGFQASPSNKNNSEAKDYIYVIEINNSVTEDVTYGVKFKYDGADSKIYSYTLDFPSDSLRTINGEATMTYGIVIKNVPNSCQNFRIEPVVTKANAAEGGNQ